MHAFLCKCMFAHTQKHKYAHDCAECASLWCARMHFTRKSARSACDQILRADHDLDECFALLASCCVLRHAFVLHAAWLLRMCRAEAWRSTHASSRKCETFMKIVVGTRFLVTHTSGTLSCRNACVHTQSSTFCAVVRRFVLLCVHTCVCTAYRSTHACNRTCEIFVLCSARRKCSHAHLCKKRCADTHRCANTFAQTHQTHLNACCANAFFQALDLCTHI